MANNESAANTSKRASRVSRACYYCRGRKSRCDLDASGGQPPCGRCRKENRPCELATSNRGGSRVRKKTISANSPAGGQGLTTLLPVQEGIKESQSDMHKYSGPTSAPNSSIAQVSLQNQHQRQLLQHQSQSTTSQPPIHIASQPTIDSSQGRQTDDVDDEDDRSSVASSPIDNAIPRNPSDAWQLLKDVAKSDSNLSPSSDGGHHNNLAQGQSFPDAYQNAPISGDGAHTGIHTYRLVREQYLTAEIVAMLVQQYYHNYHCYLPLVPRSLFEPDALDRFAIANKHLLTAVLTIASKDLVDQPNIHQAISRYMHDLVSGVAAGHDCEVEAVEALLLLAEWEPQGLRDKIDSVGRGEEDRSAWMHVGMALRTGYFLGLDRTAFRQESDEEAKMDSRKRLAWANCYVSDRLISVRIGRAFWSRGPGPMTGLSTKDFPTLQPQFNGDEDFAKIFQAELGLTQLFSNVHDVLYSGMRSSNTMILMGDYVKYVDDFRTAIDRWRATWGGIECSQHIKVTLEMSEQYLRLYTNAFVFQAQISQAISKKEKGRSLREHLRQVFSNIGMLPDARFIYGSVSAAKAYLDLLKTVNPEQHLRYMPLRFYLYAIYSAVFLYKARSFGVMQSHELAQVSATIQNCITILRTASQSEQDAGGRYARLLELLWARSQRQTQAYASMQSPAARSDSQISSTGSIKMDAGGYMRYSPAGFSWLDLEAVGDYVSGDPMQNQGSHFIPVGPGAYGQTSTQYIPSPDAMTWSGHNNMNGLPLDLNGNLLF